MKHKITIGTRSSELALWQTHWVHDRLKMRFPQMEIAIEKINTTGDKILDVPLAKIGDKGLFTKELDIALLTGDIDIAVHSLKDLPTRNPEGIVIGAITERWDARDAFVSKNGGGLRNLPKGATVATGSLRRRTQLLHFRPDLNIVDLRGNLNTRFRKFDESGWDAMILAVAGIERLGWQACITEKIDYEIMLPAVGQGSLAITCREGDDATANILKELNHDDTLFAATAERAMMRTLEGGCQIPIGGLGLVTEGKVTLHGCVGSLDGKRLIRSQASDTTGKAAQLGIRLAKQLLASGADEILADVRQHGNGK